MGSKSAIPITWKITTAGVLTECCILGSSALGGCTAHNAMIFVYPHNEDWDGIAALTGDDSWKAEHMRR